VLKQGDILRTIHIQFTEVAGSRRNGRHILIFVGPRKAKFGIEVDGSRGAQDIALLKHYYQKSNPFSQLRVENNFGLLMFYCSAFT
jgi:hypothetical protein